MKNIFIALLCATSISYGTEGVNHGEKVKKEPSKYSLSFKGEAMIFIDEGISQEVKQKAFLMFKNGELSSHRQISQDATAEVYISPIQSVKKQPFQKDHIERIQNDKVPFTQVFKSIQSELTQVYEIYLRKTDSKAQLSDNPYEASVKKTLGTDTKDIPVNIIKKTSDNHGKTTHQTTFIGAIIKTKAIHGKFIETWTLGKSSQQEEGVESMGSISCWQNTIEVSGISDNKLREEIENLVKDNFYKKAALKKILQDKGYLGKDM